MNIDISKLQSGTFIIFKSEDVEVFAETFANKILASKKEPPKIQEIEQPIPQPEALRFMGKSRQTFSKWRKDGKIKGHKLGGRIFYFKSELLSAMK